MLLFKRGKCTWCSYWNAIYTIFLSKKEENASPYLEILHFTVQLCNYYNKKTFILVMRLKDFISIEKLIVLFFIVLLKRPVEKLSPQKKPSFVTIVFHFLDIYFLLFLFSLNQQTSKSLTSSYTFACFFWFLSSSKIKLVQILV